MTGEVCPLEFYAIKMNGKDVIASYAEEGFRLLSLWCIFNWAIQLILLASSFYIALQKYPWQIYAISLWKFVLNLFPSFIGVKFQIITADYIKTSHFLTNSMPIIINLANVDSQWIFFLYLVH